VLAAALAATAVPCRATARGCPSDNVLGVLLIAVVLGAVILGVLAWIWFRWERGPFWRVVRLLSWIPRGRRPRR
jgi:hypothetical protein